MHEYQNEYNRLFKAGFGRYRHMNSEDSDVGTYVPLDKPFQDGYFFTLCLDESKVRNLPEDVEAQLRVIEPYVVNEFVSHEKRPSWKKNWDVVDDIIFIPGTKKDKKPKTYHLFSWIETRPYKENNNHIFGFSKKEDKKFFIEKIQPFMSLEVIEEPDYSGVLTKKYYYVLDKKWHQYFQFRRYNRMITHRYVLNGEKISRTEYLDKKLRQGDGKLDGLVWGYDERVYTGKDDRWDSGLQHKRAKVYLEQDMKEFKYDY